MSEPLTSRSAAPGPFAGLAASTVVWPAATAVAVALPALAFAIGPPWTGMRLGAAIVLSVMLTLASAADLAHRRLPDMLTLPLGGFGLALVAIEYPDRLVWHLAAAGAGYLALWSVARLYEWSRGRRGLGLGDAKLYAAGGAWVGPAHLAWVLLIAASTALAVVAVMRLRGHAVRADMALPFGPFIALGIWLTWLYGPTS